MTTQAGARCPECGSHELLTVTMEPQGQRISFSLCNACGWKRWGRGEEGVRFSSIQPLFEKRSREGRQPARSGIHSQARTSPWQEDPGRGRRPNRR